MQRVLEIGSGGNPILEPGWEHLDIRPDSAHVEHVQSAHDLSNFADEEFDRIVARDVIEHVPWRLVPGALREWLRVARLDVEIATPDANELAKILTVPGYGITRVGNETHFEYFNRVCFGHQDYPENSHASYFTEEWLTELLHGAGALRVETKYADGLTFVLVAHKTLEEE